MALPNYRVAKGLADGREKVAYTSGGAITAGNMTALANSTGKVVTAGAAFAKCLGVALNTTTGADEEVIVATAQPGVVFSTVNKTGGSYTQAQVGDAIRSDDDGLDVNNADANGLILEGIDLTDDPGTGATRVLVSVAPARSQAPGGSATPT